MSAGSLLFKKPVFVITVLLLHTETETCTASLSRQSLLENRLPPEDASQACALVSSDPLASSLKPCH